MNSIDSLNIAVEGRIVEGLDGNILGLVGLGARVPDVYAIEGVGLGEGGIVRCAAHGCCCCLGGRRNCASGRMAASIRYMFINK